MIKSVEARFDADPKYGHLTIQMVFPLEKVDDLLEWIEKVRYGNSVYVELASEEEGENNEV